MNRSHRHSLVTSLRRAFLLRVHPDRFRDESVRRKQNALLKKLNNRLEQKDFRDYIKNGAFEVDRTIAMAGRQQDEKTSSNNGSNSKSDHHQYYVVNMKGDILERFMEWSSVDTVLLSMVDALRTVGLPESKIPFLDEPSWRELGGDKSSGPSYSKFEINKSFNRVSNEGKNLSVFLNTSDFKLAKQQRERRIHAANAARSLKKTYQFEAIDGSRIHWSSENLIKVFNSFERLYNEHRSKFNVDSFYPLSLILTEGKTGFCMYAAEILINPASTPLMWLRILTQIHQYQIDEVKVKRQQLSLFIETIQKFIPVTLRKGPSCSAQEFYDFVRQLSSEFEENKNLNFFNYKGKTLMWSTTLYVSVEARGSYRRGHVSINGSILVGADANVRNIIFICNRLKDDALRLKEEEDSTIRKCRDKMNSIQSKYNLLHIRRQHRSGVSWSQVLICLERLDQYYFEELIGTSLRIGPSGQFCAFANDGSILVPWNFISE
mmetsp:Transcript_12070/g.15737  ORF Transcript_12070/g.15737 Transcript_12070/m.15737 type:complete len:491 (-) Transcript_12070:559-2031(-)